jgi:O-antigen/teichoic acid export membrane protein
MFFNLGLIGVAVLSNWFLIPQYGLAGAATATLISLFLFNMSRFLYIRALYGMVPFSLATLWAVALIAAVAALGHIMPPMGSWALDVVIRSAVVLILYVPVVLWLRLSEDINAFVGRLIGKSI